MTLPDQSESVRRLRVALIDAIAFARLFNRGGMTWKEYDRELVRLEAIAREPASDDQEGKP